MGNKVLNIIQINIQSLRPIDKKEELYAKIVKDKVNAVLLQEIWLKEAENFKMKNFKLVSKRRKEGYGGVGILLEEDFRYEEIDFPELGPMEVVGVKIKSGFDPVNLVSVYIPPTRAFSGEVRDSLTGFFEFLSDLEGECIIGADLNAHHESWSPSFPPCARGRFLKQQVDLSDLVLKNDKSPTTIRGPNENDSAVDITLVSPNLAWKTTWEVLKEENFGSIHCAIGITVSSNIPVANRTTKRINKSKLVEHLSTIRPQFIYSPEEMVDILDEAVEASSFVVANKKVNFLKKWWNDDINKLYEIKRQALAKYNANKTRTNYIQVQKTRAEFKREVRRVRRRYIADLTDKIDETTPSKHLWNIIKGIDTSLSGSPSRAGVLTLTKGKEFMNHYFGGKLKSVEMPAAGTPELLEGYGMALQDGEIIGALRRTKKSSAPGENKISYDVLRQHPLDLQLKISEMLSRVFVSGEIPPRWRITDVKPIPKKNADPELPNSRRPIALMNVEIKLINAAVKNRLVEIAEINNLIPELSFGFRKNRSASTCVAYVVNSVHEVKENNEEVIVAFLDVKMAYDSVNTGKLLQILAEMGIPRKLVAWLYEYLRHRVMRLETEEGVIEEVVSEGLPQGCPGAPIMYNLYTAALHKLSGESCKLVQFADDFAVIAKGASLELAEQRLNTFLNQLASKLRELDLEISAPKSAVIAFTGKRTDHLRFKIKGQAIEVVNTHVYLGFTMDRALRHRKHIEMVRDKGAEKLGLVKMLARKADGANPETLIKVGNAMIRSRMEYGASTYGNAANTHLNKLQVLQNSYIRVAMKYLKSTPVHVLLAETGQLPMKLRVEALAKKELIRSLYHRTPLLKILSGTLDREIPNGSYLTELADKHVDLVYQVHPADRAISRETRMRFFTNFSLRDVVFADLGEKKTKKNETSREQWQQIFNEVAATKYKDHKKLYTDASKSASGTALAVFDAEDNTTTAENINNNNSITNAELRGILDAVVLAKKKKYKKTVIFTDSKSGCQSLTNSKLLHENFIIWDIYKEIEKAPRGAIKIQWVPSHVGIRGNEAADAAAQGKCNDKQTEFMGITMGDACVASQKEIWEDWSREYKTASETKGRWHYQLMESPSPKIWFKGLLLGPAQIKLLSRIRSGHTLTKDRRALWRLEDDNLCELCLEVEDLKHSLYYCPKYNNTRSKHHVLEYMKPLEEILKERCEESMKQIYNFIKECRIQT